ncbi:type II and III secretion system protein family protein [uncultured Sphingomonas sp.]|uniref:type II and III secretion system protein family protein n=1 Tax=uncultured Sphingomonas sp. TaxID=158754 RepID=UPI002590B56A|nr:type II and III secretion system protein family protein [uncultured Sphingomonas sp.]
MRVTSPLAHGIALAAMAVGAILPAATAGAAPAVRHNGTGRAARVGPPPPGVTKPAVEKWLSIGEGELITLPASVVDVWTSNPDVADVYVANPRQIHLFGKGFGESTLFATDKAGNVAYAATIRVSQNSTSLDRMMKAAMPEADIHVTQVGQIAVLNGTVASPDDSAQAQRLVTSALNPGVDATQPNAALKVMVVNRLRTATPLQVNLQVKFAEVSRTFLKNIGANLQSVDGTGGFQFGLTRGRGAATQYVPGGPLGVGFTQAPPNGSQVTKGSENSTFALAGKLLGLDLLGAIDAGETMGQVTTLANPNLTALSGETGTFLAGGEIPIPLAQALGTTSVEYKQFGVSLAYTPTVLSDGRISLRVRPEVSQLDYANAITISGGRVPALTTRRAETTVELGSGQSFMIAGLMQNMHNNNFDKTPGLGSVPVLGALFRSNAFQHNETELVIVITPYLVKPVNGNDIRLPTDGYRAPGDMERLLLGSVDEGQRGLGRPKPVMQVAPAGTGAAPAIGAAGDVPVLPVPNLDTGTPAAVDRKAAKPADRRPAAAAPGFSIN